ncbi:hypothetical protein [Nocardioides sp. R-C-SC26]|uniref:hypothetical protein n=1 Tax=Nocardioides sp. R-C-SC26 TaxID=2870414 RepID=UPI001E3B948F|nr:hypothetical protein [Nocardioides sp. R-C-SC26]
MPRPPDVQRHEGVYVEVFVRSGDSLGLHLGDLRELVARAEGVPDNVLVEFEEIERSYIHVDEYRAKVARVRSHRTETTATNRAVT